MRQYRGWANCAQNSSLILETVWGFFISVNRKQIKQKEQQIIEYADNTDPEAWSYDGLNVYKVTEDYPFDLIEQYKLADDGMFSIKPNE